MRQGIITTDNIRRAHVALHDLKKQNLVSPGRSLMVIEGLTGRGKTSFAEQYYVQDRDAKYISADENWTPSWLLRDVAEALGLPREHASENNKRAIVEHQREARRRKLLLIDEADWILRRTLLLDTIRGLHDRARLPMVLVGEAGLWGKICRKSPRFARRVSQVVNFGDVAAEDVEACARELADLRLPPERAVQIQRLAEGSFGVAVNLLEELERVLKANPGEVSRGHVELAAQNLRLAGERPRRRAAG